MPLDDSDSIFMERALELTERGRGLTAPNPMVGAVIVADREIVGEGYHTAAGGDHAEIAALKDAATRAGSAAARLQGATMYVTLEPCCNWGRTPPCVPAVLSAGFARVVVGAVDPSPLVNGKGIQQLREAGVVVELADGALANRCKRQNDGFRKTVVAGLPFVTYKYAMTLDGRIAADSGDSRWVSGAESRILVHRMRSWVDAVVVGAGTLRADDPLLTARDVECRRQPVRVVVDPQLTMRHDAALVRTADQGPVLVVCGEAASEERRRQVRSWGVEVEAVQGGSGGSGPDAPTGLGASGGRPDPLAVGRLLVQRGVQCLLLEGGAVLAGAWWTAGLVDKVVAFVSPRVLSGEVLRSPLQGAGSATIASGALLREVEVRQVGADVCISGYVGEAF